ncbi:MAG: SLC13 family permease [Bacteroidota bacterium]
MLSEAILVYISLAFALVMFVWGKLRHDVVAILTLFLLVVFGLVPTEDAFLGFGHPAVITVASVLVIGKSLELSGLIDVVGQWVLKIGNNIILQVTVLSLIVAISSAFMNNVGALAIMIPIALHLSKKSQRSPSLLLMPIAFASLLGGMITLIGTPPNIIIAQFRSEEAASAFGMFDFAPVGIVLSVVGIVYISLLGWRLIPIRNKHIPDNDTFQIEEYITEIEITSKSSIIDQKLSELETDVDADIQVLGLVRNNKRVHAPRRREKLEEGDILIIESDKEDLNTFLIATGTKIVGDKKFRVDAEGSDKISLIEAIVLSDSPLVGNSASSMRLRHRYDFNLLAIARKEKKIRKRIGKVTFQPGDLILLQGRTDAVNESIRNLGCMALEKPSLKLDYKKKIPIALGVFLLAVLSVITGFLQVEIAFTMGAVAMALFGIIPLKETYTSIDWSVIVLLAAMIPAGNALETSGGADQIANLILAGQDTLPPWLILGVLLTVTMLLSALVNNAATVVLMAPIAITIAKGLDASIDPFLMAVAIGGSSAFMTPIGHQSNTLVMGPGGYKFSDYLKMGIPMQILIILASIPLILYFWPL